MTHTKPKLCILGGLFTIHRFPADCDIPKQVFESIFYSISKTQDEVSVVCDAAIPMHSEKAETGWRCIKVEGPLDFTLTGILSDITAVLASSEISIFALSTYDTDYILVRSDQLSRATDALTASGYTFTH